MDTIRLFMWGYQRHFQASVEASAEKLFKGLNPDFEVEVFLLGIARQQREDLHPICLEPEDCGFDPSHFRSVADDAKHHLAIDPEKDVICMDAMHQRSYDARVRRRALRKAVLSILNGFRNRRAGEYHFLGLNRVGDYDVGVVLRLHCKSGETYSVPKVHADDRYAAPRSLLESAIYEFLIDCQHALYTPSPELVAEYGGRGAEEILREAGRRLMDTPIWAAGIYITCMGYSTQQISSRQ